MTLEDSAVQLFIDRLANRTDVWYKQLPTGSYAAQKPGELAYEPVTLDLVKRHLDGVLTCGFTALNATGLCKWACWDSDKDTTDLGLIEQVLRDLTFHPLTEGRRPGRSGHLWLFLDKPIPAVRLIMFDRWLRKQLGLTLSDLEFFPKQAMATVGSQVRVPLGINRKPEAKGARGWFEGPAREVDVQISWFLEQPLNAASKLLQLVEQIEKNEEPEFKIVRFANRMTSFNIWDHVQLRYCRKIGLEFVTQCPVCAAEGHDRRRDNLHILDDDSFICMFGEPGKTHARWQIVQNILGLPNHRTTLKEQS